VIWVASGERLSRARARFPSMPRCAFLSTDDLSGYVADDALAIPPLAALGWRVETLAWRTADVAWGELDLVVVRSTWDYHENAPAFERTLAAIDRSGARLANPLPLLRWNLRKSYLLDLAGRGVPIVPTTWERGLDEARLRALFDELDTEEIVVKPLVGASSSGLERIARHDRGERLREVAASFAGGSALAQPFLPQVACEGEYSLVFLDGERSHAIRKVPRAGDYRTQEEAGASIEPVAPEPALAAAAEAALARVVPTPLYARVDLVRGSAGGFLLMELELLEPSLYLRMDPAAPTRLANAVDRWWRRGGR